MSYKVGYSVSIHEIAGAEYDPVSVEEMNDDNVEPFDDMINDVSVTTPELVEYDLRRNIISNISVS